MSTLLEPFGYDFFVKGLLVSVLAGGLCGLIGVYVILRGMSYIGHGMSHAIFGGAIASYVMKINFYLGAGVWGFASAMMINRVARRRILGADAAIGVITTASFAVGVILISLNHSFTRNFEAALFGSVLAVTITQVLILAGVAVATGLIVFLMYRRLLFTTFDPEVAEASGVDTGRVDALFALILATLIVATMNVLGVTLIAAALVVPAASARLLTDSFGRMLVLSTVIGALAGFFGLYISYFLNVASAGFIVVVNAAVFLVVYVVAGARGARLRLRGAQTHA